MDLAELHKGVLGVDYSLHRDLKLGSAAGLFPWRDKNSGQLN